MNPQNVFEVFESGITGQIMNSDVKSCNIKDLKDTVDRWKHDGYTVVFTAGVFDILTINHLLGLYHYRMLGGKKVKLIVSLDSDNRAEDTKSFVPIKGNSVKPILSWKSRSIMLAKQSFLNKRQLVDLIIQHGADTCGGRTCPHDDNVTIAEEISPDLVIVTSTSQDTVKMLQKSRIISTSKLEVIKEDELAYSDKLTGGIISNSSIIKRIKHGS
jgi:hypothetical protein